MERLKERLLAETKQQDVHKKKDNHVWVSPTKCETMRGRQVDAKREKKVHWQREGGEKAQQGRHLRIRDEGKKGAETATLTLCPKAYGELLARGKLTLKAKEEAVKEAVARREELAMQSADRAEEFKQVKEIVTQEKINKRTKHDVIVNNASKAIVDNEEEMKDFYSTLGASQALVMRQKQINDKIHFKDLGLYNFEAYNTAPTVKDAAAADYNELRERREQTYKKNRKILEVLAFQCEDLEMKRKQKQWENEEQAYLEKKAAEENMKRQLGYEREQAAEDEINTDIFQAIQNYNNVYMKSIRAQDDRFVLQREKEFTKAKAEFKRAFEEKEKKKRDLKNQRIHEVQSSLSRTHAELEKADYEANYVILTEKANQQRDEEIQSKLNEKLERENLQKDWEKIRQANLKLKNEEIQRGLKEKRQLDRVSENEGKKAAALQMKHLVEKDVARMEILHQINERDKERKKERNELLKETSLLRAQEFLRQGKVKNRMQEKLEQAKQAGLPMSLIDTIAENYNLN